MFTRNITENAIIYVAFWAAVAAVAWAIAFAHYSSYKYGWREENPDGDV